MLVYQIIEPIEFPFIVQELYKSGYRLCDFKFSLRLLLVLLVNSRAYDANPKNEDQNNLKKELSFHLSPFGPFETL